MWHHFKEMGKRAVSPLGGSQGPTDEDRMTDQIFDELKELLGDGGRFFKSSNVSKELFDVDDDVARASKYHTPHVFMILGMPCTSNFIMMSLRNFTGPETANGIIQQVDVQGQSRRPSVVGKVETFFDSIIAQFKAGWTDLDGYSIKEAEVISNGPSTTRRIACADPTTSSSQAG